MILDPLKKDSGKEQAFEVRAGCTDDLPFLWEMLFEAAAVAASVRALGKEQALGLPELRKYLEGWGREGDQSVIATARGEQAIGAAWARLFSAQQPGYGFVAPEVPELSVAVVPSMRGQGVGTALLKDLMRRARAVGYKALSLSVDRANPALALYQRLGFQDAGLSGPEDNSLTMLAAL